MHRDTSRVNAFRTPQEHVRLALALTLLATLQGCDRHQQQGHTSPQPTEVRLAAAKNLWNALPLIADERGYFVQEGLLPRLEYLAAGRYCLDALLSNSADVGFIVEVNVAYLGYTADQSVSVLATVARSEDSAIVARKSSGVLQAEDLRGKTVALSPGTTSDIFAHRFLAKHNLKPDTVTLMNIQPNGIFAAATSGQVDAASTWEPFVHNIARALGENAVVFRDSSAYRGYMNMAVRKAWGTSHRPTVLAVLRALRKAEEFALAQPSAAKAIVSQRIDLDRETVDAIWPMFALHLTLDSYQLSQDIAAEGQWIESAQPEYRGRLLPDYRTYIDASYLEQLPRH